MLFTEPFTDSCSVSFLYVPTSYHQAAQCALCCDAAGCQTLWFHFWSVRHKKYKSQLPQTSLILHLLACLRRFLSTHRRPIKQHHVRLQEHAQPVSHSCGAAHTASGCQAALASLVSLGHQPFSEPAKFTLTAISIW